MVPASTPPEEEVVELLDDVVELLDDVVELLDEALELLVDVALVDPVAPPPPPVPPPELLLQCSDIAPSGSSAAAYARRVDMFRCMK
jgi:hypothetical protein